VKVGPHVLILGDLTLINARFACLTAVWIVKAGSALQICHEPQEGSGSGEDRKYIEAMDWKVAL
jgi:hypothetical protein